MAIATSLAIAAAATAISAGTSLYGANKARKAAKNAATKRDSIEKDIKNFKFGKNKEGLDNPYANVTNAFANTTNPFSNQRVATGAADRQSQQFDQSQANILDAVVQGGANAGGSATALAQQAAGVNQQISAGLQQQQQRIQGESARGEQQRQQLFNAGEQRRQELVAGGEQYVLGLSEKRDQATLAGLGARIGQQNTLINSANTAESDAYGNIAKSFSSLATAGVTAGVGGGTVGGGGGGGGGNSPFGSNGPSDPRLKENIRRVYTSKSGIPVYQWNYIGGNAIFEGAMSTEVPKEAVIKNFIGKYDGVAYDKIDVNFKEIQ